MAIEEAYTQVVTSNACLSGKIAQNENGYAYLCCNKVSWNQLGQLKESWNPPKHSPHVTISYEKEARLKTLPCSELGRKIIFRLNGVEIIRICNKEYLAFLVLSEEIINLRTAMGLRRDLNFYGYDVPLHLTVGYREVK